MIAFKIIIGLFGLGLGLFALRPIIEKHKKIDTESIAIVKEVIPLGRDDGKKVYAIKYDVKSSNPFELLESPCKKALDIGKQRSVFYEKEDTKNFYFKTIGQFDSRFIAPCAIMTAGFIVLSSAIMSFVF